MKKTKAAVAVLLAVTAGSLLMAQSGGEKTRARKPGDSLTHRMTGKLEAVNPQNNQKMTVDIKGTRNEVILAKTLKDPKGRVVLQRSETSKQEVMLQGTPRVQEEKLVDLISFTPDGSERLHGRIIAGKTEWVNNKDGFIVNTPGLMKIGMKYDSGKQQMPGGYTRHTQLEFKRKGTVKTPAGSFAAYYVEGTREDSRTGKMDLNGWLSPKVGIVQMTFTQKRAEGTLTMKVELTSAKLK
ncbi:MAG: hypothetical protein KIT45_04940 [Fimbriimonadia bacterium]|nr:hypothetical protein [Fimbriimonadia bacterium]